MGTYHFKQYRRTKPNGTTGELVRREEIEAGGLAFAAQAAEEFLREIDFTYDFAILEGDTGFVRCWLRGPSDPEGEG
jgi:hypothetical protein